MKHNVQLSCTFFLHMNIEEQKYFLKNELNKLKLKYNIIFY